MTPFDGEGTATASQPEVTTTPAPETTSTPDTSGAASGATSDDPASHGEGGEGGATPAPTFQPNYKYKVRNKEYEIPEYLRPAIASEEHQKSLVELHEKAMGLDFMKPRLEQQTQELTTTRQQLKGITEQIGDLRQDYQRGDFDSFFQKLKVPEEKILQWLVNKLDYNELPPEQQRIHDERKAAEQRAIQAERRAQTLEQGLTEREVQASQGQFESVLEKDEVKSASDAYDSRPGGKPGDFRTLVCDLGELAWNRKEGFIPPEEAVKRAMAILGGQAAQGAPAEGAPQGQAQGGAAPVVQKAPAAKPPVIPNVRGQNSSPMKSKPKSLEDLKKLAASFS